MAGSDRSDRGKPGEQITGHRGDKSGVKGIPPPAEEWDFQGIQAEELEAAIRYEYGRSSKWVRKAFEEWHAKPICLPENKALREWRGQKVRDVLRKRASGESVPEEVWNAAMQLRPDDERSMNALTDLILISPLFPTPFLRLPPRSGRRCSACPDDRIPRPAFIALEKGKPVTAMQRLAVTQACDETGSLMFEWREFKVLVDLREPKHLLKKTVGDWIDGLDDRGIPRNSVRTGKAAAKPWFRLRELAAYRLAKEAGLGFNAASRIIDQKIGPKDDDRPDKILPDYRSEGAWYDAVKSAQAHIRALFPDF